MKKTILEIYALAVCFVTVTCFIVCLGISGYSFVRITKPDFTMESYVYDRYQSNDNFWQNNCRHGFCSDEDKKMPRPSEDQITKKRLKEFEIALKGEQRDAYQTLVKMLIVMLADSISFFIHWLISKKARQNLV
jgi:hypothetical protein